MTKALYVQDAEQSVLDLFSIKLEENIDSGFLNAYVDFNSVFGIGVLALTSRINSKAFLLGEQAFDCASHVYSASIDEFSQPTHRSLALNFLRNFHGVNVKDVALRLPPLKEKVLHNYLHYNLSPSVGEIYLGLGFHLASEYYANAEFSLLDKFFREKRPSFVEAIKDDYQWISLHSSYGYGSGVEDEHYRHALESIACLGQTQGQKNNAVIIQGIENFEALITEFLQIL